MTSLFKKIRRRLSSVPGQRKGKTPTQKIPNSKRRSVRLQLIQSARRKQSLASKTFDEISTDKNPLGSPTQADFDSRSKPTPAKIDALHKEQFDESSRSPVSVFGFFEQTREGTNDTDVEEPKKILSKNSIVDASDDGESSLPSLSEEQLSPRLSSENSRIPESPSKNTNTVPDVPEDCVGWRTKTIEVSETVQILKGVHKGKSGKIRGWKDKRTLQVEIGNEGTVNVRRTSIVHASSSKQGATLSESENNSFPPQEIPALQKGNASKDSIIGRRVLIVAGIHKGKTGVVEAAKTKNTCWVQLFDSRNLNRTNGRGGNEDKNVAVRFSSIEYLSDTADRNSVNIPPEFRNNVTNQPTEIAVIDTHQTKLKISKNGDNAVEMNIFNKKVLIVRGKHKGKSGALCGKTKLGLFEILLDGHDKASCVRVQRRSISFVIPP